MIKVVNTTDGGLFIQMSRCDASLLIRSLSNQIIENSPNAGRWEPIDNKGNVVTIAVEREEDRYE